MSEYRADWPPGFCSMAASSEDASAAMPARSASGSTRHAVRRKRIIWCRTLYPSVVSGTGGVSAVKVLERMECEAVMNPSWTLSQFSIPAHYCTRVNVYAAESDEVHSTPGVDVFSGPEGSLLRPRDQPSEPAAFPSIHP